MLYILPYERERETLPPTHSYVPIRFEQCYISHSGALVHDGRAYSAYPSPANNGHNAQVVY